jgi:hypothetical protein
MAIATPRSVVKQMGNPKHASSGYSKGGGSNQGKVSGTHRRYSSHPRKRGQ